MIMTERSSFLCLFEVFIDVRMIRLLFKMKIDFSINKDTDDTVFGVEKFDIFLKFIFFHHFHSKKFQLLIVINDPTVKVLFGLF